MRRHLPGIHFASPSSALPAALAVVLSLMVAGCNTGLEQALDVVTARDLAGTYTGVLQGVTVDTEDDIGHPDRQVIVDIDLLHEVTIREAGKLTLWIESQLIPPLRAFVLGIGPVAINAEFVEFEGLDIAQHDPRFDALKVKQIVFVAYEGEWIPVLQLIRVDTDPEEVWDGVYVFQFVAYPSRVAQRMSEEEAIVYVNGILRLASAAQRL